MTREIVVVDAFADRPFAGNPAAVCILPGPVDEVWMQAVAGEMNLSETAFLHPEGDGYRLRWFTPTVEVDLCGHATLASAHVLWEGGMVATGGTIRFDTRSGVLKAEHRGEWIELDFPAEPADRPAPSGFDLAGVLGLAVVRSSANRFDVLAEVEDEAAVRSAAPDLARLATIDARGLIITAPATTPGFDFVSRFFAPSCGVPEDPVTGSAHCALGPYWSARLGRTELVGYQASARGGVVRVAVEGDRVRLGGRAMTMLRGAIRGPGEPVT